MGSRDEALVVYNASQVEASEKSNLVVISEGCSEMLEESNGSTFNSADQTSIERESALPENALTGPDHIREKAEKAFTLLCKPRETRTAQETIELAKYLKDGDVLNWRYSDSFNGTLLHVSTCLGDFGATSVLLRSGADVNASDCNGDLPINKTSDYRITKLLLSKGSQLNPISSIGTPLHVAIILKKYSTVRHLLKKGAKTDIVNGLDNLTATQHVEESSDRRLKDLFQKYQDGIARKHT